MKAKPWLDWLTSSLTMDRRTFLKQSGVTVLLAGCASTATQEQAANADSKKAQITSLYDAFGKTSTMQKDWGFSAYIEYGGKRILFDTGDNAEIFAHNVKAKGIDLTQLDFAVVTHRHGDHTSGLNYLMTVNPGVPIYVPHENFGVFGATLPGTFYKRNESLPADMRYFDGKPPEKLSFGTPWPQANFKRLRGNTEIAPGFQLIMLKGSWGVDLDVMEISLAIDTPDGIVLVVGCSHPTIEKVVETTKAVTKKPIHLVVGGTHLLPATNEQISQIAGNLHDKLQVAWIAPVHCTGERAFGTLKQTYGDHYVYAGLGSTILLGPTVTTLAEAGQPHMVAMDQEDLRSCRELHALSGCICCPKAPIAQPA